MLHFKSRTHTGMVTKVMINNVAMLGADSDFIPHNEARSHNQSVLMQGTTGNR